MDSIVNDRYLLNERVLVKMLVFPVLFNIVVDILAITLIARAKEEEKMNEILPHLIEDGLSISYNIQMAKLTLRLPPVVLTISSADVELRNSKKKENKYLPFLVCMLPHPVSGKTHNELVVSFWLAEGFLSFLSPPTQPKQAISTAVGQGLIHFALWESQYTIIGS